MRLSRVVERYLAGRKRPPELTRLKRYGVALLFLGAAFFLRLALTPIVRLDLPYLLFIPAALGAAWYGGFGPGFMVLAGGYLLGDLFFAAPLFSLGPYDPESLVRILTYVLISLLGIGMVEAFHRTRNELHQAEIYRATMEKEITERKRAEEELRAAQRRLQEHARELEERVAERTAHLKLSLEFLEGVLYHAAHDLRAPLRAMHGFTEILLTSSSSGLDATGQDYARRVWEASRKADRLVTDLLEYGRLGYSDLAWRTVDLGQFIPQVLEMFAEEARRQKARIEVGQPLPMVRADPSILGQVLTQLLENALKFVAPGAAPCVRIWAEAQAEAVRVFIRDTGIGFDPRYGDKIFGIFERLPEAEDYPGTGIGLAIAQKGVQRMGGHIGAESVPGQGSCFWIDLSPAVVSAAAGESRREPALAAR